MKKTFHRIIQKFKKPHVLDIVFLCALVIAVGWLLLLRQHKTSTWVPVTLKVSAPDWWWQSLGPEPWYGAGIETGLTSYNALGEKVAEIIDVENYETDQGRTALYVTVTLNSTQDARKKGYAFQYQPLQIGGALNLTFGTQNIRGLIAHIGERKPTKTILIEARLLYVFPWVAQQFTNGLSAYDSQGRTIAKITSVTTEGSRIFEFIDKQDRVFAIDGIDSTRKDVIMRIEVAVREIGGSYYYVDGTPIKIGESLHLEFPRVVAHEAEISDIILK